MNNLNSSLVEDRARVGADIRACNIAGIEIWMLLTLVGAPPANSSSPPKGGLRQELQRVCRLAI